MNICKKCKFQNQDNSSICSNCGSLIEPLNFKIIYAQNKWFWNFIFAAGIGLVLVFFAFILRWIVNLPEPLVIYDENISQESENYIVATGYVRNDGSSTYTYIEVRFTGYDSHGAQVVTETAYIDSDRLPPGANSRFSIYAEYDLSKISTYQLSIEMYGLE
jgi:hypothetical protein